MNIREAIDRVTQRADLSETEVEGVMGQIMEGEATPAQIASFITGLRMKGETVMEVVGAARAMRGRARKLSVPGKDCLDTCGTGGDGSFTFNISTAAALVASGCGLTVAKHGNRSVSSSCGSADVLRELGVNIECAPELVEKCLAEVGVAFFFAPLWHPAMKFAIGPRREIGIRTVFNLLGPLTNPAGATSQLLGVYDYRWVKTLAEVLEKLGSRRVMVVNSQDGLDEISLSGITRVAELKEGEIKTYDLSHEDFGLPRFELARIQTRSPQDNARVILGVLTGEKGPHRDVVLINAAAALSVGGKAGSFREGVDLARASIDSGAAREKLRKLAEVTNQK
ncbi:MAG: anthranilate phosphoribosyltransferase [Proteobacteria bacterium]|nr:anthranilate phosphoribosyltransferase [Pseudomonadota bacterium]